MNLGSDPADQVVRYTLEGSEFALRMTGTAAKNFAVFVAAVLRDQKRTRGKTNLTRLLRAGKPLKFFSVPAERMREFTQEAKRHGLLFVPMRDRTDPSSIEIAIWADDAAKVERIIDRMQLDVVETGEAEIMSDVEPDQPATQTADSLIPFEQNGQNLGFTQPAPQPAEPAPSPPSRSTRRTDPPSVPRSGSRSSSPSISPEPRADQVRARGERPSVRTELREIMAMLRTAEPVAPKPKTPIRIHRGQTR
ncbi:MAG: PcfB family protein [Gemmiger sp.]